MSLFDHFDKLLLHVGKWKPLDPLLLLQQQKAGSQLHCSYFLFQQESMLSQAAGLRPSLRQKVTTHSSSTWQKSKRKQKSILPPGIDSRSQNLLILHFLLLPSASLCFFLTGEFTGKPLRFTCRPSASANPSEASGFSACLPSLSAHNSAASFQHCLFHQHQIEGLRSRETGCLPS